METLFLNGQGHPLVREEVAIQLEVVWECQGCSTASWGWERGGGDEGWFLFGCFPQVYWKHCADYWGWLNHIFLSWCILSPQSSLIDSHHFFYLYFFYHCWYLELLSPCEYFAIWNMYLYLSYFSDRVQRMCVQILQLDHCSLVSRMRGWLHWH